MFDIGAWLTESLISGVCNGIFAREYVAVLSANYMLKGLLTADQVEQIATATPPDPEPEPEPDVAGALDEAMSILTGETEV